MARFTSAIWQPISVNVGGTISGPIGVVLHQTAHVDPNWNPHGWFNNPTARVSAHFFIAGDGRTFQFIDTARQAWHAVALNRAYIGVEVGGPAGLATTPAQIAAFGRLMAEANRRHGIPLQLANRNGERGLGFHRMPGSQTSTACPSDLRLGARPAILAAARGGAPAPAPTPPTPTIEEDELLLARGSKGGIWLIIGAERQAITDAAEASRYRASGVRQVDNWTDRMIARFRVAQPPR